MKRTLRFSIVLAAALAVVPFLPLYIKRTMMRSMVVGHAGDVIHWGWKISTLVDYWSNYRYTSQSQSPAIWLGVNLALAFTYALAIAFIVDRLLVRRKHSEVQE
jgi:hypothetical protein